MTAADILTAEAKEKLKQQAYSRATSALRREYRQEFDDFLITEYDRVGLVYTPRPTEEQRAEQTVRDLLAQYPDLRKAILDGDEEE